MSDEKDPAPPTTKYRAQSPRRWKFFLLALLAVPLVGLITMLLWNWLMPSVFGLHTIDFLQALGLLLLSKIIFGSFHGRGHRRRCGPRWDRHTMEGWESMTPEERRKTIDAFRAGRRGGDAETTPA
jgi:hypothetical protein